VNGTRVAVFGGDAIRSSIVALGLEPADEGARVAIIDLHDPEALARAGALDRELPRVLVADESHRSLIAALGVDPARVAWSREPAILGPALAAALPRQRRPPTRTALVTGVRGGVGRTLLVTNLARRIAARLRVCVVDVTGSGAAAWWLRCDAAPWSGLEGLAMEMTADHLSVAASEPSPGLRLIGGPPATPSAALSVATVRAAVRLADITIVDGPLLFDTLAAALRPLVDRCVLLAYDEPWSRTAVAVVDPAPDEWLVVSQSRVGTLDGRAVFRALPRDEAAVTGALGSREKVGGALGRAYDDLAELLLIDAS